MESASTIDDGVEAKRAKLEDSCDEYDVYFVFPGESDVVTAKKYELGHSSEVFRKQFEYPTAEKSENPLRITISDISYASFAAMVQNVRGLPIPIGKENYKELLYAARKYLLSDLTLKVVHFLSKFITGSNLIAKFEFLERFEIRFLNDHMKNVCIRAPQTVIHTLDDPFHTPFQKKILETILESPILGCSEYELYQSLLLMWKKLQRDSFYDGAKFKKDMGNWVYSIRFPNMTVEQLVKCGKSPSLLTVDQVSDLQLWVLEKTYSQTLHFFSANPRIDSRTNDKCASCRGFKRACPCSRNF